MSSPGDLVDLDTALKWLGLDEDADGQVAQMISAASNLIQKYIGYNIASQDYVETHNGAGNPRILLKARPVTAVAGVNVENVDLPAGQSVYDFGFAFDDISVYFRGDTFCRGFQNIKVRYTAGYASVPADLQQACLMLVDIYFTSFTDDLPANVSRMQAGDTSLTFGDQTTTQGKSSSLLPPQVAALVNPYCRVYGL